MSDFIDNPVLPISEYQAIAASVRDLLKATLPFLGYKKSEAAKIADAAYSFIKNELPSHVQTIENVAELISNIVGIMLDPNPSLMLEDKIDRILELVKNDPANIANAALGVQNLAYLPGQALDRFNQLMSQQAQTPTNDAKSTAPSPSM